jgi:hypothetical protein
MAFTIQVISPKESFLMIDILKHISVQVKNYIPCYLIFALVANAAAGIVVAKLGAAAPSMDELQTVIAKH